MILLSNEEAAEQYVKNANLFGPVEYVKGTAFLAGCSHVESRDREFYLMVREYIELMTKPTNYEYPVDESLQASKLLAIIKKHLAAFTAREQASLNDKV
jgi:hypothetical protein